MNKTLGPTFGAELVAAGLQNGLSWDADFNIQFSDDVLQPQRDAVMSVVAAHDPTKLIVPEEVTRYQGEVVARRRGWYESADAIFAAMPDSDPRKIAWLRAPTWQRHSDSILYAAQQMGITDADLDEAFIEAGQVK